MRNTAYASRGVATSGGLFHPFPSSAPEMITFAGRVCCPMGSLAWSPFGRLASRRVKRRKAVIQLCRYESMQRAPWSVVMH